jgi:Tol biopolymer transport system component
MRTHVSTSWITLGLVASLVASAIGATAEAGTIELLTRNADGVLANGSSFQGQFVKGRRELIFGSTASNLAPNDVDSADDVLVLNLKKRTFDCVSLTDDDQPIASPCYVSGASTNGRYVAFLSAGTGIAPGVAGGDLIAYVRDRKLKTTRGIAFTTTGAPVLTYLYRTRISPDGRFATFASDQANVVPGIAGGIYQTYLRDLKLGTTELISVDTTGGGCNADAVVSRISKGGRYVFFETTANDVVANDTNGDRDLFVRDRKLGTTTRVSVGVNGELPTGIDEFDVSPNGRFVTFSSSSDALGLGVSFNGMAFWLDRKTGSLRPVANSTTFQLAIGTAPSGLSVSANGRRVALLSTSTLSDDDLGPSITDVYLCTPKTGALQHATKDAQGGALSDDCHWPAISGDGKRFVFSTNAADAVGPGATSAWHLFLGKP